jgi:isobutyryl-CoA dehydrogenase
MLGRATARLISGGKTSIRKPFSVFHKLNDPAGLTEEQLQIQETAMKFAQEHLAPNSAEWDRNYHFPIEVMKKAADYGFTAIYTSEAGGGVGLGRLEASLIFEALAYGDVSTSAYLSIHNMVNWMIDTFGNDEQRKEWCTKLSAFELMSSYCLTEPNAGSDALSLKTSAKKDGSDYVLNGSKCFISGGPTSGLFIVMCKTSEKDISAIIVPSSAAGIVLGKNEKKMGWRNQPTSMVTFDNVRVPQKNLLGKEGEGFKFAMKGLNGGRINIASCSLGGAALALNEAITYAQNRKQFNKALSEFQNVQFKLADMATDLVTSRLIVRKACNMMDNPQSTDSQKIMYSAMAKKHATDVCFDLANYALQIHGGYGYLNDYPIERIVRDLRVHQILEGTNEIMRMIIARKLFEP